MSQMPDKIWLHKDTKYIIENIVCGYQYELAQKIEDEGIENFVEYICKDALIDKACKLLKCKYDDIGLQWMRGVNVSDVIDDFRSELEKI